MFSIIPVTQLQGLLHFIISIKQFNINKKYLKYLHISKLRQGSLSGTDVDVFAREHMSQL